MKKIISFLASLVIMVSACAPAFAGTSTTININADSVSHNVSSTLYGISLEDDSFGIDGGLSANMINNNSFEYSYNQEYSWDFSSLDSMISTKSPINKNNPTYETLTVNGNGYLRNLGYNELYSKDGSYDGSSSTNAMTFKKDVTYRFTCYLMDVDYQGKISVFLDGSKNKSNTVNLNISDIDTDQWTKVSVDIKSSANEDGCLGIKFSGNGSICIDYVTLVPEDSYGFGKDNWQNSNLRSDLVSAIKDLNPSYISFPGDCVSESDASGNLYSWKDTIGTPVERKQTLNINDDSENGYYYNNDNLVGYYEYFQLCNSLNAIPVAQVGAGIACQTKGDYEAYVQAYNKTYMTDDQWKAYLTESCGIKKSQVNKRTEYIESLGINSKEDFDNYISSISLTPGTDEFENYAQDILDLIEYANGDSSTSYWASIRKSNGSEEPFNLEYIQIGGDNYGETYWRNFAALKEIINEKYPDIKVNASTGDVGSGENFDTAWTKIQSNYTDSCASENIIGKKKQTLADDVTRYDSYSRNGATVFAKFRSLALEKGAYYKNNNMNNAVDEATFMLGLEKNSDIVEFSSYKNTLAKYKGSQAEESLIWFDNKDVLLTPSYYTQMIFSNNVGNEVLSSAISTENENIYQSVTLDEKSETLYIKIVNTGSKKEKVTANLNGFDNLQSASIQTVYNKYKTAYNSFDKQTVAPSQEDIELNGSSLTYEIKPYSANVIRIAYGNNSATNLYQIPDTINTEVKRFTPMSKTVFIIMILAIFVIATFLGYFAYSKIVLKGKKPDFKNTKKKKDDTPDEE